MFFKSFPIRERTDDNGLMMTPYKLKNNAKDAMTSALAYWGWKMINPRKEKSYSLNQ
ncbi:hypothetical protein ACSTS3_16925 [Aquimarina muelleri]|uniref:hypothetical protein n=1 Tax=Aquimarina muelleri TaxID=279356 RepID=UPI003F685C54